jgi:hypothetical protein
MPLACWVLFLGLVNCASVVYSVPVNITLQLKSVTSAMSDGTDNVKVAESESFASRT